jgi:hypothetical protein
MMRAVTSVSMAALLLAGCASAPEYEIAPPDPADLAGTGPLFLETAMDEPVVPDAPPPTHDRGTAALKGAGMSALVGLQAGASTHDPFALVALTALGVAAAPFVALGAAIAAPVGTDVQDAAWAISSAVRRIQWDLALRDAVESELTEQGQAIAEAPIAEAPAAEAGRLKLTVEGPWLALDAYTAVPTLTVHGELARGDACPLDRRWRWNGDADHFVDLGEDQATAYRTQMEAGLKLLAEAVAADILGAGTPRKTAYRDEASAAAGGPPLVATDPLDHQKQIGSWDKTDAEDAEEPRCSGIEPADGPAASPETETCRGLGCRNV